MTLEGLHEFEAIRDYLYTRMRGSHQRQSAAARPPAVGSGADDAVLHELAGALREVTTELKAVRRSLEARTKDGDDV
jgi:putative membrane protein